MTDLKDWFRYPAHRWTLRANILRYGPHLFSREQATLYFANWGS